MARRELTYQEGDWFAVPLRDGGFGVGVAARVDGRGGVVGYFFGPRRKEVPTLEELRYGPEDAVLVCQLGDLGLLERKWLVIGRRSDWDREAWPVPVFGRVEPLGGRAWKVEYSDADLNTPVRETPASQEEVEGLPRDSVFGAGAVERLLTHLLS